MTRILGGLDRDGIAAVAAVLAAMVPDNTVVDEARARAAVRLVQPCLAAHRVIADVAGAVSDRLGVPADHVYTRARHRAVTDARQVTCWVAAQLGLSYSEIGRQVGRDHTTIWHGVTRVENDPRLRRIASTVLLEQLRNEAA